MMAFRLDPAFLARPIAHRGLHDKSKGVIENSMSAITAAIDHGYGIEIDVQISRDDDPIVFHDYDLVRLVGRPGFVRAQDTAALRGMTLTGSIDPIPTLADVLAKVAGQVPLLVEIKDQDLRLGPAETAIEAGVADLLVGYDGPVAVMSFNPHVVARIAELSPDTAIGLVSDAFDPQDWATVPKERLQDLADLPDVTRIPVDFVSHSRSDLASPAIARVKQAGLPVLCWTVRDAAQAQEALKIADQITFEGFLPQL